MTLEVEEDGTLAERGPSGFGTNLSTVSSAFISASRKLTDRLRLVSRLSRLAPVIDHIYYTSINFRGTGLISEKREHLYPLMHCSMEQKGNIIIMVFENVRQFILSA